MHLFHSSFARPGIRIRTGVAYCNPSVRRLYVMEVWEEGGEDFSLIDMVKYQAKPPIIYARTKSEESFFTALQQNDGTCEAHLKLVNSSIFCYEKAWHRTGVANCDSSVHRLYVMEVREEGGEIFPLIDMVKYQAKPLIIYTSTKSEESFFTALQKNDGTCEAHLKLMNSSIFCYEKAWHRTGVAYCDSSVHRLYVMEVREEGGEDFPLIDMVKYQAKPLIMYTSTKSEESFFTALQKNDGKCEALLKLMKSSIFSYEKAWHRLIYLRVSGKDDGLNIKERSCYNLRVTMASMDFVGIILHSTVSEKSRNLLQIAILDISYDRGVFPVKFLNDKSGPALDIKKLIPMDAESRWLIDSMEKGVYDALQKKYPKTLLSCVREALEGPVIEEYASSFNYVNSMVMVMLAFLFYDFFTLGGGSGTSYMLDSSLERIPSNTPVLVSKSLYEDSLLFFHPHTRSTTRFRPPGIRLGRLQASSLEGWLIFTGRDEGVSYVTMYNVNSEEHHVLPSLEVGSSEVGLFSSDFNRVLFVDIDEDCFLTIKSYTIGDDMWLEWKHQTLSLPDSVLGFMYSNNYVYWLDTVGIHLFSLEEGDDEGDDEEDVAYDTIVRGNHVNEYIAQGCLIDETTLEDVRTFDLLLVRTLPSLRQINLNLETRTITEQQINSLGSTSIYSIDRRGHQMDKGTGYRLPASAEWDTGKVFLYGDRVSGGRTHCKCLDLTGIGNAETIASCDRYFCNCTFGWIRLDPR